MNPIEQKLIQIFHNSQLYEQEVLKKIHDFIITNEIYKKPINIQEYNLDKSINRLSSPIEILNKHLKPTKYKIDISKQIQNNIIPITKK